MKNMYLAAAMAVSLAFTACSDDESGKADRAYNPIEILGTINDATDVQNTRAVGSNWGADDRIGVTVDGPTSGNAVDTYINIQYRKDNGNAFRVVNEGSVDNNIRLKGDGAYTLAAYYPYQGENGALPGEEGVITKKISGAEQSADKQPQIDFLFAEATEVYADSPVTFNFTHRMAKIILRFAAKNGGTFDVNAGEAVAKEGATPDSELTVDVAKPSEGEMNVSIILFPQEMTKVCCWKSE